MAHAIAGEIDTSPIVYLSTSDTPSDTSSSSSSSSSTPTTPTTTPATTASTMPTHHKNVNVRIASSTSGAAAMPDDESDRVTILRSTGLSSSSSSTSSSSSQDDPTTPSTPSSSSSSPSTQLLTEHFRTYVKKDKYMLLHKCIYFIGMGANASIYPFLVIRFRSIGLTDVESGSIMAIAHVLNLLLAPIFTNIADRSEHHRRGALMILFVLAAIFGYCLRYATDYTSALLLLVVMDVAVTNCWPILDSSVHACLEAVDGHSKNYGNTRAFGAAGWGIWAWCSGAIFDTFGLDAMFVTFLLALLPILPLAWMVPVEKRAATKNSNATVWKKLMNVDVLIFAVVVYISSILLCICDVYRTPYLAELGASNELLGFSVTATAISEAPFFFVAGYILKRVSTPFVLLFVLLAYALRFWWYSILIDPWWTIPAELLHGVQFALGWAASTSYVALLLPPELSSTAQGLLAAVQWGMGSSTGALLGGAIMGTYGARVMFRAGSILALFGAAIMALSMYRTYRRTTVGMGVGTGTMGGSGGSGKGGAVMLHDDEDGDDDDEEEKGGKGHNNNNNGPTGEEEEEEESRAKGISSMNDNGGGGSSISNSSSSSTSHKRG